MRHTVCCALGKARRGENDWGDGLTAGVRYVLVAAVAEGLPFLLFYPVRLAILRKGMEAAVEAEKGTGDAGEKEGDLEKEMNANQWSKEEHYHFLKVRVSMRACMQARRHAGRHARTQAGTRSPPSRVPHCLDVRSIRDVAYPPHPHPLLSGAGAPAVWRRTADHADAGMAREDRGGGWVAESRGNQGAHPGVLRGDQSRRGDACVADVDA